MKVLLAGTLFLLGSCTPEKHSPFTEDQAFDRVLALPEVLEYAGRIRELSGSVRAIAILDGEPAPGLWNIYVGENHPTHTVRRNTFQVDGQTGIVRVYDDAGDLVSLAAWRFLRAR